MFWNNKYECWNVAIRKHLTDIENNKEPFIVIPNTFRYWAADPFVVYKNGLYYIFAELYDRLKRKGDLGYCIVSDDGIILKKWKVLVRSKVHMSFPNPTIFDGKLYFMPESGKEYDLRLYSAENFPEKWTEVRTILKNTQVCDTIKLDENHLWAYNNFSFEKKAIIYQCDKDGGCRKKTEILDHELRLRPGGNVFLKGGRRIAPLQNCKGEYGRSLFFTEIISNEDFTDVQTKVLFEMSEKSIKIKDFSDNIVGLHTYNFDGDIEVIDVKTRKFTIADICGQIFKRLKKL